MIKTVVNINHSLMEKTSLDSLYVFCTAAQSRNFSQAARELHLTPGAVSRKIKQLEVRLGIKLFTRSFKGVSLTKGGEELFNVSKQAIQMLDQTVEKIKRGSDKTSLHISCERSLAMKWLIPRLGDFQQNFPDIPVRLSTGGGTPEFTKDNIDAAIRRADFLFEPSWNIVPFMQEYIGPVCKQNLVSSYKRGDFVSLHTSTRPDVWKTWFQLTGNTPSTTRQQLFDHFFLCLEAAISGLGVAIVPYAIAMDAISNGQLLAPDRFVADGSRYVFISKNDIEKHEHKFVFLNWLRKMASELDDQVPKKVNRLQA